MCCFSQPVRHVSNTEIFARLSGLGTQFLVYQMTFASDGPNAMVTLLPNCPPSSRTHFSLARSEPSITRDTGFTHRITTEPVPHTNQVHSRRCRHVL